jgi:hypothetical protein
MSSSAQDRPLPVARVIATVAVLMVFAFIMTHVIQVFDTKGCRNVQCSQVVELGTPFTPGDYLYMGLWAAMFTIVLLGAISSFVLVMINLYRTITRR